MEMMQLQQKIDNETNPYKLKSLKEKMSWLKAEQNGQYVTIDYLKENRDMIIRMIQTNLYFKNKECMVEVMNMLVDKVNEGIVYRSQRGIKGIIRRHVINLCEVVCLSQLGDDMLVSDNKLNYIPYNKIKEFYLNIKMK